MNIKAGDVCRVKRTGKAVLLEREFKMANWPGVRHFYISDAFGTTYGIGENGLAAATMTEQRDFWRECYFELLNDL